MPNRVIRDWTTSEAIDRLSFGAEVFYTRLIMKADDHGNYTGNPKLLKAALFPLRDVSQEQVAGWVNECADAQVIILYYVDGKQYINIPKFGQRLRQMRSRYPQPADNPLTSGGQPAVNGRPETKRNEVETKEKVKENTPPTPIDFSFASSFSKIFNKPYPKERGAKGEGQAVDMILRQLSDHPPDWILGQAKAMRAVYETEGWSLPTNPATIINSLTETDWVERLKDSEPEKKAERKLNQKLNGTTELPPLAPANAPGALG